MPRSLWPHRFSLTWRVLALSSLLLLGVAGLFTYLGHATLTRQFDQSRAAEQARQMREVRLSLHRSAEQLQRLASIVAASPGLAPAVAQRSTARLDATLQPQWPALQLDAGVDDIRLFDADGQPLGHWGEAQAADALPSPAWHHQVLASERPITALYCRHSCRQYAAVPILGDGRSLGVVKLSRSLAEVTRQAHQMIDSHLALLVQGPPEAAPATGRHLVAWGGNLMALTQTPTSLPLLHRAMDLAGLADLERQPLRLSEGEAHYELTAIALHEPQQAAPDAHFLLLTDITAPLQAIQRDTRRLLYAGLGGWLAAELLLLLILLKPMARLRRLASVLPILAHQDFARVRARIPRPRRCLSDEIDRLEATTLELATRLESQDREITTRGQLLAARVRELGRERDFIGSLLDTARVLILAQDAHGRVTLANAHALHTLGVDEDALLGRHFDDIFPPGSPIPSAGGARQEEERRLVLAPDITLTIVWYHAALPDPDHAQAARISVGLDISERKAAEARLTWLAQRDSLTELYNRRYFEEALGRALGRHGSGAVLLLDLDQFKVVNELSGHEAGDRLLCLVADTLFQEFGYRSLVARLGGDEFALLLEGADEARALRCARQIAQLLEALPFISGERQHRISASIGIALYPVHGDTPGELMAGADVAMYQAKASRVQPWHLLSTVDEARHELKQRVYWVERIRRALSEDAFALMVQPIVRLADGEVRHYEVLLRLRDDDGTLLSPGAFIPVAERTGLILSIDRWVLRHSLRWLAAVQQAGVSLAVNLSAHSLHDERLCCFLAEELAASGADPHHLILEITETAAVTDFATARGVLDAMRKLGCRTALDDFGVGFSSFHYLGQLPVDYIKIDGSFIRTLTTSADSRVIVKAMADIASGFGKQAVAEFVDQPALLGLLTGYGITYGQGYHLGKPRPIGEVFCQQPID